MLFGRDAERAEIAALLKAARASRSAALVVRGDPGIGKTALLEDARGMATDMHVLTARGIDAESELPFAGLHQLLRPALSRIGHLPEPQARALRGALGLADRSGDDRFLISVACLTLLADLAEQRPVLCLVDDAQWLDEPSADALLFVSRRLDAEGIVMMFSARDADERKFDSGAIPVLRLEGLDAEAAARVVTRHAGADVAPAVRDALVRQAHGNALALAELPVALTGAQLAGDEPLPGVLPLSQDVERLFADRVRRLSDATQRLLLVAAADDSGDLATVLKAAEALGADSTALDGAERSGLLNVRGARLDFRHPLVRSAVYQTATRTERATAHRALAEALDAGEADRRAWHVVAGAVDADEDALRQLDEAARRASDRGGHAAAARAYERAAGLTADAGRRGRRLTAAAVAASMAGRTSFAVQLAEQAQAVSDDPLERAACARVRGIAEMQSGTPHAGLRIFLSAAAELPEGETERALEMLVYAAESASLAGDAEGMREVSQMVSTFAAAEDDRTTFLLTFLAGLGPFSAGDAAGAPLLERAVVLGEASGDAQRVFWASAAAAFMGDLARGGLLAGRAAALARQRGQVALVAHALSSCAAYLLVENRFAEASADAEEAVRLGRQIGAENLTGLPLGVLAMVAALRGREDVARGLVDEMARFANERGLALPSAFGVWALAYIDLARGNWAEAFERYDALSEVRPGFGHPLAVILTMPDRIETLVRLGRPEEAAALLPAFEGWASQAGPAAAARLASCRALVASGEEANRWFDQALAGAHAMPPFDVARIRLLYGEQLRRGRRRVDAREQLRVALKDFERFDASVWAERARTELRASGESARRRDPSTVGQLTPQELQIARFVAEGLSNKDVAAQLFLSPRTVHYHLRNVFSKLGITSRSQLAHTSLVGATKLGVSSGAASASGPGDSGR